jgi:hypothetical protein
MTDADTALAEKLQRKLEQKAGDGTGSTETEAMHGDEDDEEDDDETDMEMSDSVQEALQTVAEEAGVTPAQVEEMLAPLMGEEDTTDHDGEMAADTPDIDEVAEVAAEAVAEALPDGDLVTEDDLESKLEDHTETVADTAEEVVQKANVETTPTPTGNGDVADVSLFSDSYEADK